MFIDFVLSNKIHTETIPFILVWVVGRSERNDTKLQPMS